VAKQRKELTPLMGFQVAAASLLVNATFALANGVLSWITDYDFHYDFPYNSNHNHR
jgi:hypothetical protein